MKKLTLEQAVIDNELKAYMIQKLVAELEANHYTKEKINELLYKSGFSTVDNARGTNSTLVNIQKQCEPIKRNQTRNYNPKRDEDIKRGIALLYDGYGYTEAERQCGISHTTLIRECKYQNVNMDRVLQAQKNRALKLYLMGVQENKSSLVIIREILRVTGLRFNAKELEKLHLDATCD